LNRTASPLKIKEPVMLNAGRTTTLSAVTKPSTTGMRLFLGSVLGFLFILHVALLFNLYDFFKNLI
jgi:hypothetical protein